VEAVRKAIATAPEVSPLWPEPDASVLRQGRRAAPPLPIEALGPFWGEWVKDAAEGANCPVDYCAAPLLAAGAALIGNARWVSPWAGWEEPSVLWCGIVGDPSSNKSPGIKPILELLKIVEENMAVGFEDKHRQWQTEREMARATLDVWKREVKDAAENGKPPPQMPPAAEEPPEPPRPRVIVNDTTPEKLGDLCAAHEKGLLSYRDELAGWFGAFDRYSGNGAERALWLEAYQGNPHTIDRMRSEKAIRIRHLSISVLGGIQPDKLVGLIDGPDDGLPSRFLWTWPEPVPPKRPERIHNRDAAVKALRRLSALHLGADDLGAPQPRILRLTEDAADQFHSWREEHAIESRELTGTVASAWGKAPGHLLRLALVLEHLWWCGNGENVSYPERISRDAILAAIMLVTDYFKPMAARVYGDAALPKRDRLGATLARRLLKELPKLPTTLNARRVRRDWRLPGLREADDVRLALDALEDGDWLRRSPAREGGSAGRQRDDYTVNPRIKERADDQ
jgi:hypothetical protein